MKVVLDANIVVSGVLWKGNPGRVLKLCIDGTDNELALPYDSG